jgi:hypothetical protein
VAGRDSGNQDGSMFLSPSPCACVTVSTYINGSLVVIKMAILQNMGASAFLNYQSPGQYI